MKITHFQRHLQKDIDVHEIVLEEKLVKNHTGQYQ